MRPDAYRWIRPDAARFLVPGTDPREVYPALQRKFNPDQPRVPAGNPDGGQWTDGGGGLEQIQYRPERRPIDLLEERDLGGHAIEEHVGKSESYLKGRVRDEADRTIARGDDFRGLGVTSFTSLSAANRLVNSTIDQNHDIVEDVTNGARASAFIRSRFGSATGYEAYLPRYHAGPYIRETYGVGVFILSDPKANKGWRVQSAYPER
ncbi:MAG: hypothetical protein K0Q64_1049 [Nitrobacter vulgaris]|jgi:hypothetical protein|nr:hypothetical protein [Nitrobacter vulgaris]